MSSGPSFRTHASRFQPRRWAGCFDEFHLAPDLLCARIYPVSAPVNCEVSFKTSWGKVLLDGFMDASPKKSRKAGKEMDGWSMRPPGRKSVHRNLGSQGKRVSLVQTVSMSWLRRVFGYGEARERKFAPDSEYQDCQDIIRS